jgi:hypothetical protein
MDTLYYVASFWLAGVGMGIYNLYLPAIQIIGRIDKSNIAYRYAWVGGIVFTCFLLVFLPILIHVILMDKHQERFLKSFIPAYMGDK